MQFSIHLDSKTITRDPSTLAPDSSARSFIRGDGEPIEILFTKGNDYDVKPVALPGEPEIRFLAKRVGDFGGRPLVVNGTSFVYDSADRSYTGHPSFGQVQMAACFVGAGDVVEITSSITLTAAHKGKLLVCTGSGNVIVTLPASVFSALDKVHIMRGDTGAVTLATSGVTLTDADGLAAGINSYEIAAVTFASPASATASVAVEAASIALGGEITWRDAAAANPSWSTVQFAINVDNERFRGNEGNPVELGDADDYYTKAAADGRFLTAPLDPFDLSDASITGAKLAPGAVTGVKLGDGAVTAAKLADGAVTAAKLATPSVTSAAIGTAVVTTVKLADGAVTAPKIADASITGEKLAPGARAAVIGSPVTATAYTFGAADADAVLTYAGSSTGTFTIPLDATAAMPIGTSLTVLQMGVARAIITGAFGVTLSASLSVATTCRYEAVVAIKIAADTWVVNAPPRASMTVDGAGPLVVGTTYPNGGVEVLRVSGDAGRSYEFELDGLYTATVATEGLGLYFVGGTGLAAVRACVRIGTTAAGAIVCGVRTYNDIAIPVQATGSAAAVPMPFRVWGSVSIDGPGAALTIKACTESGGANYCTLQYYTTKIAPTIASE